MAFRKKGHADIATRASHPIKKLFNNGPQSFIEKGPCKFVETVENGGVA
jgi:hypothetical protein